MNTNDFHNSPLDNRVIAQRAAAAFFGSPVIASERTWQALEDTHNAGGDTQTYVLLASIIRHIPAACGLLQELGFNPRNIRRPFAQSQAETPLYTHIRDVLGQAFLENFFNPETLNPTAREIRDSRSLLVHHLLRGPLDSPYNWPTSIPQTMLSSMLFSIGADINKLSRKEVTDLSERIRDTMLQLHRIDPSIGDQQFVLAWDGKRFRIRPFAAWGNYQLSSDPLKNGSLWIARGNVIEPSSRFSPEALNELEHLIEKIAPEADFQDFFKRNPEFMLALGDFSRIHPQLILHEDN